jgi:hypothetical protein
MTSHAVASTRSSDAFAAWRTVVSPAALVILGVALFAEPSSLLLLLYGIGLGQTT